MPPSMQDEVIQELDIPDWVYSPLLRAGDTVDNLIPDTGDRAAISTIIGVYSYCTGVWYMKRYTQVLASALQGLLVKTGRFSPEYREYFRRIWASWKQARLLMVSSEDHALADCLFSRIETALKLIAERERFTKNTSDVYSARLGLQLQEPPKREEDPYGI